MSLFDTGIRPAVDEWLLNKSKEVRNYGNYWSASSAGYCHRRVIFERLGVPKVESAADARKQRVFTSGTLFHEWLQSITKEAGLSIAQELELQDEELMIRGHIDDLVLFSVGVEIPDGEKAEYELVGPTKPTRINKLILYDYKSQNSRAFSYKRPEMSHYHRLQLGTYLYMLRKSMPKIDALGNEATRGQYVNEGRILKISKDDLRMAEEQLLWSPELEKEVYSYWSTLNGYWKSKKMPRCTCGDYEGGFLAKEQYNGFYYDGEPCSIKYYEKWKAENETSVST